MINHEFSKILIVNHVCKDFEGLQVLKGVNLSVGKNDRHAMIGPNGAGKTTFFNIITGNLRASSGSITYKGKDVSNLPPYSRTRLGIGRSFQITNVFQNLSVFDNVQAGVRSRLGLRYHLLKSPGSLREINTRTEEILRKVNLIDVRYKAAKELSYGQQRALEVAITLSTEPELILLDEPTAGMTREETEEFVKMIHEVTQDRTLIIIEHDMDVVFSLSSTISVLHYGSILISGKPDEIRNEQRVKDAYLGEEY